MVHIYPFAAVRPADGRAQEIAAVPYDVVSAQEARQIISEQPLSFLRISRADALLTGDPYGDEVYNLSRDIFSEYRKDGLFIQEKSPFLYIYHVLDGNRSYSGIACCLDTREYQKGIIKRHELTRYDKEEDRTRHIDTVNANTGPVVLLHQNNAGIAEIIRKVTSKDIPVSEVTAANGSRHFIYQISDPMDLNRITKLFSEIGSLYIADGHHRCKSAVNITERRQERGISVPEETYHVMGVVFAEEEVKVHGYSRLLTNLGSRTPEEFLAVLKKEMTIEPYGSIDGSEFALTPKNPDSSSHIFHLYLPGCWYECAMKRDPASSVIDSLDVSVLQGKILEPLLGITDPRGDPRLQYLGGARPLRDLEQKVKSGEFMAAISMQPVNVGTVFSIADQGGIMPPKSTWFEPKLLSGLLIHLLE